MSLALTLCLQRGVIAEMEIKNVQLNSGARIGRIHHRGDDCAMV